LTVRPERLPTYMLFFLPLNINGMNPK
jgi:hypothetical protein